MILKGLGGIKNIEDIDCCATRLRITVTDETKVTDQYLKQSGSKGIIKRNRNSDCYGPQVSVIKSNFEEYVEYYAQHGTDPSKEEEVTPIVSSKEEEKKKSDMVN